jgi:hypothetical protein
MIAAWTVLVCYQAWDYTGFCPQSKARADRLLKLRLRLLAEK